MSKRSHRAGEQLALGVQLTTRFRMSNFVDTCPETLIPALEHALEPGAHGRVFLQGPIASGKTHLLQALCHLDNYRRAIYLPLERRNQFSPELIAGFTGLDLICVDDVHVVAGNPAWEQALFSLFNDAEANSIHLVIAAREPPAVLSLPDLVSRLEGMLRLTLPGADDARRMQILKLRGAELGFELDDDVGEYLLHHLPRDLHSLIHSLEAIDRFALRSKRRVNRSLVREYLAERA